MGKWPGLGKGTPSNYSWELPVFVPYNIIKNTQIIVALFLVTQITVALFLVI